MSTTLFHATAARFEQTLSATAGFLEKGRVHCEEQGLDLAEVVDTRLHADMLPLRFQVVSTAHHAAGALEAARTGEFRPPPSSDGMDFAALQHRIEEALAEVRAVDAEALNALAGNDLTFRLGEQKIPFLVGDFLLSFSIPNFYFHATTTYDILRHLGAPLGKRDFLGQMLIKS